MSNETFTINKCESCHFLYTNPRPDPERIGKYYQSTDYISHVDTSNSIKNIIYQVARRIMMHKKLAWIDNLATTGKTILDYGCGVGTFPEFCQSNNWDAWGIEPSENARKIATEKLGARVQSSFSGLPEKQTFDVITLWHVLEHVHELHDTIEQLLATLSVDGWMLIAVPNPHSYDANYYKEFWAGYDLPRHLYHFAPENMKFLAKKYRLQLLKTIPLKLDAYYICLLSENYRNGSALNALYQAYRSNRHASSHHSNFSSLVYVMRK